MRFTIVLPILILYGVAHAQDAVEAAASCVVIHEASEEDGEGVTTCFENISLERNSFESGVCQWKTDAHVEAGVKVTTRFVPHCPTPYSGSCDRLVMGPGRTAPVKIFLYSRSEEVLERARRHCIGGGGSWHAGDKGSG